MTKNLLLVAATRHEIQDILKPFVTKRESEPNINISKATYGEGGSIYILVTGMGRKSAQGSLERALAAYNPGLVISVGVCGALNDRLRCGDAFLVSEVIDGQDLEGNQRFVSLEAQRYSRSIDLPLRRLTSYPKIVTEPEDKLKLGLLTSAEGVDLETIAVAKQCEKHHVPWLGIRAVSDEVQDRLPKSLQNWVDRPDTPIRTLANVSKLATEAGIITMLDLRKRLNKCTPKLGAAFQRITKVFFLDKEAPCL